MYYRFSYDFSTFQILYSQISGAEKLPLTSTGCPLRIRCKTFHILTFVIPRERACVETLTAIKRLSQPGMSAITNKRFQGSPGSSRGLMFRTPDCNPQALGSNPIKVGGDKSKSIRL